MKAIFERSICTQFYIHSTKPCSHVHAKMNMFPLYEIEHSLTLTYTLVLHLIPSPHPFTSALHLSPTSHPYTSTLQVSPSPPPFTSALHLSPSSWPFNLAYTVTHSLLPESTLNRQRIRFLCSRALPIS